MLFRPEDAASVWTARVGPWAKVFSGEVGELTVDLEKAYFFDPDTGQAIHHAIARPSVLVAPAGAGAAAVAAVAPISSASP
jgi:hypothetical protein